MNTLTEKKIIHEENEVSYTFILCENVLYIEAVWQVDYAMWTATIEYVPLSVNELNADETKIDTSYIVTNYTPTDKFNIINDYVHGMLNLKEYELLFKKVKNTETSLVIEIITKYPYSEKEDVSIILIQPKPIGFSDRILKNIDIHKNSTNTRFTQLRDEINLKLVVIENAHDIFKLNVKKLQIEMDDTVDTEEFENKIKKIREELINKVIAIEKTIEMALTTCAEKGEKAVAEYGKQIAAHEVKMVAADVELVAKMSNECDVKIAAMTKTYDEKIAARAKVCDEKMAATTKTYDDKLVATTKTYDDKFVAMQTTLQEQITKLQTDLATCMSKLPQ